jgi:hypothetical protein
VNTGDFQEPQRPRGAAILVDFIINLETTARTGRPVTRSSAITTKGRRVAQAVTEMTLEQLLVEQRWVRNSKTPSGAPGR